MGVGDVLDIIGAVAVVCASYTSFFVELEDLELRDVAIGGIIVVGLLFGGEAHTAAVAATAAAAIPLDTSYSMGDLTLALVAGLFVFGGWHMVTYSAEEAQNPERTISFALIICTLMVTGCYVLLNAVYLYVLPMKEVASSDQAVAHGRGAGLVVFSTIGALSGIILSGPRVCYAMARDGLLFRWLGEIH